ncbi:MAG: S9 family peptidase [Myxococcota bacterium]
MGAPADAHAGVGTGLRQSPASCYFGGVHAHRSLPLLLVALGCGGSPTPETARPDDVTGPPMARRVPHTLETHGLEREDPYYWMRDDDREDPEVLAYLEAENRYADAELAPLAELRETLFEEIVGRIPQDDASVPYREGDWWYYRRFVAGEEYALRCRTPASAPAPDPAATGPIAGEEVLLDENARGEGEAYYAQRGFTVSPDGQRIAFGEDRVSRRQYVAHVRDLGTGEVLPDRIEDTTGSYVFSRDGGTLFYVKREEGTLRAFQVWRHRIGTPASDDVLVYEEEDDEFYVGIGLSRSEDFVLIGSAQSISNEWRVVDADRPESAPRLLLPRERGHEHSLDHWDGRFYVRTNWEARDFRLMSASLEEIGDKARWREEIGTQEDVLLGSFELFTGHLVVSERREGIQRLRVLPWAEGGRANLAEGHEIAFDEAIYTSGFDVNAEPETGTLRLGYTSMTTPRTTLDYAMDARTREVLKVERVVGDFDPSAYVTRRLVAPARDGETVYVSLVHRADLGEGPHPTLLYGYGSYGYSMDPRFSSARLSLLDRGFVFAIAHVRGGQEKGRRWYDDGKLHAKRHTFEDFVDVAEHLVAEGLTTPAQLTAQGGSAGGLLMGAVANMRPDLFRAIVADVPFVDVLTTMLDETIPLTTFEYDEWGNPNDRSYYDTMAAYSPYDNVRAQAYPEMLVLTGLHDSQVQYWEPAKWVARLRHRGTGDQRLIFRTNMDAGHGGASGRFRRHEETALIYAFLLNAVGD